MHPHPIPFSGSIQLSPRDVVDDFYIFPPFIHFLILFNFLSKLLLNDIQFEKC